MATDIIHTLVSLEKIESSYEKRREIDKLREANGEYSITTTAKEIARNYSYVRENGYRDGYGFLGTVKKIDSELKILLPTSMNEEAETWRRGEEHSFMVRFLDWDSSYKHYKLLATSVISIPSPGPPPVAAAHTPVPTHSEPSPSKSKSVLKSKIPSETDVNEGEVPEPNPIAKRSINQGHRHEIRKTRKSQKNKEPEKGEFKPQAKQLSIHETRGEPERTSTIGQTPDLQQTQMADVSETQGYMPAPVSISKYAPPTLQKVPVLERIKTFGSGNKPMTSSRRTQQVTDKPTRPFEFIQSEYKKPLILGLKIFGAIFAAFLLLTCICCGAMT